MSLSLVHPSFGATASFAVDWGACSALWSLTIRTARSRTSGEFLLGDAMGSQRMSARTITLRLSVVFAAT